MQEVVKYNSRDFDYFVSLIAPAVKKNCAEEIAKKLLTRYLKIENVIMADIRELEDIAGNKAAIFLKLIGYISARRVTDQFTPGKVYNTAQIQDYFKAIFIGASVETVYLMSFDKRGAFIRCDQVGEGTVNASDVLPRKLLETAKAARAASVVLAHNHPFGNSTPSRADEHLISNMQALFYASGIRLDYHCVVAGQDCTIACLNSANNAKRRY